MDFISKSLTKFIGNMVNGFISAIANMSRQIYEGTAKDFLESSIVGKLHNIFLLLSISLIILFAIKRYFDIYIMETGGDPESDPIDIIVNSAKATAVTIASSWLFATYINFTISIARSVTGIIQEQDNYVGSLVSVSTSLITNITSLGIFWMFLLLFITIGIIIFFIIGVLRAVDLMLMYIITPLFCVELVSSKHERFDGFLTNLVVTGMYYILQLICFSMFCQSIVSILIGFAPDSAVNASVLKMIGWLIASIRSPKWLDKFIYASGLGDKISRGSAALGTSVVRSLVYGAMKGK